MNTIVSKMCHASNSGYKTIVVLGIVVLFLVHHTSAQNLMFSEMITPNEKRP